MCVPHRESRLELSRFPSGNSSSPTPKKRINVLRTLFGIQYALDLRKPDLRKNLDLRKIVGTTDFLVHKLFDLRKIFSKKWKK